MPAFSTDLTQAIEDDKTKEEIREIELSKLPCNTTPIPDILAIHLPQHGEAFSKTVFELRDRRVSFTLTSRADL
jgi:hypothetical protein